MNKMLLTDDEISDIYEQPSKTPREFARSIEQAVIAKLREQNEPIAWGNQREDGALVLLSISQHPEDRARWMNPVPLYLHPAPSAPEWQPINGECNHDGPIVVLYTSGDVRISHSNWIGKQIVKPYNRPAMPAYMSSIDEGWSHWLPIPKLPLAAARSMK